MNIKNLYKVYFSPNDTTKNLLDEISKGLITEKTTEYNLTNFKIRKIFNIELKENELILIGIPIFEEKIPELLLEPLNRIIGNNNPVVIMTVYENIGEGIALKELKSIASKSNLKIIGAASFDGNNTININEAKKFGEKINEKLNRNNYSELKVNDKVGILSKLLPEESVKLFTKKPNRNKEDCKECDVCINICPVKAINEITYNVNDISCIRCFACVRKCPENAREMQYKKKLLANLFLNKRGMEPKIFI